MKDSELRQLVFLARSGIRLSDFEEFDPITLSACAIIAAEFESGGRWSFEERRMIMPS